MGQSFMKHLSGFNKFINESNVTPESDFSKTRMIKNPMEDQTRAVASTTSIRGGDPELSRTHQTKIDASSTEMDWDTLVDTVSLAIEGIPGVGTIASAAIDLSHGLSYLVRWYLTKNEDHKIEYGLMSCITLASCFIPGVGNAGNIIARGGIKKVLKQTPTSVIEMARKAGIVEKPVIDLMKKSRWQYSLALFLGRYVSYQFLQDLGGFIQKIDLLNTKNQTINSALKSLVTDLKVIQQYLKVTSEIGKKAGGQL